MNTVHPDYTPRCTRPRGRQRGLTLIESICTLSVLGTALGIAAPSLHSWQLQHALLAAAAELETDIHHARSEAVTMQRSVRLDTQVLGAGSCYVVHTGTARECTCVADANAVCRGNAQVLRVVTQRADGTVRIASTNLSIAFDPQRGTVTPTATLKVIDSTGRAVHQIVNIMGRVRSCAPTGNIPGIKPC